MKVESWSESLDDARALLARMTLSDLIELLHRIADEIMLREMEQAQ